MTDLFTKSHIFLNERLTNRNSALEYVSKKAESLGVGKWNDIYEAFKTRESEASTGMLDGIAMPHAISPSINHAAIIYVSLVNEISDWETFDSSNVDKIIAMLVPKDEEKKHLQVISNFATSLVDDEKRAKLDSLNNIDDIYDFLNVNEVEE